MTKVSRMGIGHVIFQKKIAFGSQKWKQCWVSHCVKMGERLRHSCPWRPMQLESAITLNIRGGAMVLFVEQSHDLQRRKETPSATLIMMAYIDWDLGSDAHQHVKCRCLGLGKLRFETGRFAHLKASPFAYPSWPQL